MIQFLDSLDKSIMLALNFDGGSVLDTIFWALSSRLIWIPIAIIFLYYIARRGARWQAFVFVIVGLALTVTVCDQISSSIIKPLCERPRPSHAIGVCEFLHYVGDYRGGAFGFVSSHAANAFGVWIFTSLFTRSRMFSWILLVTVILVSYSRIYLGVHYPGDITCGAILGVVCGWLVFVITKYVALRLFHAPQSEITLQPINSTD